MEPAHLTYFAYEERPSKTFELKMNQENVKISISFINKITENGGTNNITQ